MPQFVVLTKNSPILPIIVDESIQIILVFDAMLQGYKHAIEWIKRHWQEGVYRMIIPYADDAHDVHEYMYAGSTSMIKGCATHYPKNFEYPIVPLCENSVKVFELCVTELENQLLLRDRFTGISKIQQYALDHAHEPFEVCLAMCVSMFKLPSSRIKPHIQFIKPPQHGVPYALTNGPFPLNLDQVKSAIILLLNRGVDPNWDCWEPSYEGFVFERRHTGWVSVCVYDNQGNIIGLPYGVSKEMFLAANPLCDRSTVFDPICFSDQASKLLERDITWDPAFLQNSYSSISTYMTYWMQAMSEKMDDERIRMSCEYDVDVQKRNYLRTIMCQSRVTDSTGMMIRAFLDESLSAKKVRIMNEYKGYVSLLDTPTSELDLDVISGFSGEDVPESFKDIWIKLLSQQ